MKTYRDAQSAVMLYGVDIMASAGMQAEKQYKQHGRVSVYEHSINVACLGLYLAALLHIRINKRALVRGALLHDYFLYDWHVADPGHRLHGFTHARTALCNASRDFDLSPVEKDMIAKHMFPLNITPPSYRESLLVCLADKICAAWETLSGWRLAFLS